MEVLELIIEAAKT